MTCALTSIFTLKTNPLKYEDLQDFIQCYNPENRRERTETDRFHTFSYEELVKRDKCSLDIFWLKDESLEDSARTCLTQRCSRLRSWRALETALERFKAIYEELGEKPA
jgi:type I restriction enzyme M protein